MNNSPSFITKIVTITAFAVGAFAFAAIADTAWVPAPNTPPNPNVDAPLNAGLNQQSKKGELLLNTDTVNPFVTGLEVWGNTVLHGGLKIPTGAGLNKVLTSDASGNATWATASGGGGGSVTVVNSASCTATVSGSPGSGSCTATCTNGQAIGGAFVLNGGGSVTRSSPASNSSWQFNVSGSNGQTLTGTAICLTS